jgi:hypothetical protein
MEEGTEYGVLLGSPRSGYLPRLSQILHEHVECTCRLVRLFYSLATNGEVYVRFAGFDAFQSNGIEILHRAFNHHLFCLC